MHIRQFTDSKFCLDSLNSVALRTAKTPQSLAVLSAIRVKSKARFHVTVFTQLNKCVVYFIVRRNIKLGCSEC